MEFHTAMGRGETHKWYHLKKHEENWTLSCETKQAKVKKISMTCFRVEPRSSIHVYVLDMWTGYIVYHIYNIVSSISCHISYGGRKRTMVRRKGNCGKQEGGQSKRVGGHAEAWLHVAVRWLFYVSGRLRVGVSFEIPTSSSGSYPELQFMNALQLYHH